MTEEEMGKLEDFIAVFDEMAFCAELEDAAERYADDLIDQGREEEPVEGMPAWWYKELYGAATDEELPSAGSTIKPRPAKEKY